MSGDLWQSEVVAYGFMVLNLLAVALGLAWAWRRGLFTDLDATMHAALELPADPTHCKENVNG